MNGGTHETVNGSTDIRVRLEGGAGQSRSSEDGVNKKKIVHSRLTKVSIASISGKN